MIFFFRYLGNHLLILSTLSYGVGIALHAPIVVPRSLLYQLLTLITLVSLTLRFFNHRFASILFLGIAFILFGFIQGDRNDIRVLDHNHIAGTATDKETVVLIGNVSKKVSNYGDRSRVQLDVYFVRTDSSDIFTSTSGKVLLTLKDRWPESMHPGDSVAILAKVKPPPVINVPGTFNYRKYLAGRNIYLTGTIASPAMIQPVKDLKISLLSKIKYAIERQRSFIEKQIDGVLPDRTASLYKALIIGDRSSIDPGNLEVFKRAGILHILAISGMHLGLLAAIIFHVLSLVSGEV